MDIYWTMQSYTEVQQAMNSMERISEYLDLPSEPATVIEGSRPPAHWPSSEGGITVKNLAVRYAKELEPVLHGVSFDVKVRDYFRCATAICSLLPAIDHWVCCPLRWI